MKPFLRGLSAKWPFLEVSRDRITRALPSLGDRSVDGLKTEQCFKEEGSRELNLNWDNVSRGSCL